MESFKVTNLTFTYPEAVSAVLSDISFTVEQGEFVIIGGLSGCGKSTLLRQLKTCLQPFGERSGNILFEGVPLEEVDFRTQSQKIGFVTQSPDDQSVTDKVWHELAFGLESLGLDNRTIQRRTAELASFFGIEKWFEMSVDELSGGQKQILNLASVMVMQPSVLILDEPTAQLDPIASGEFISMLRKINRELGTTVIMTEHTLDEIFPLCDRIIIMENGRMISNTTPAATSKKLYSSQNEMFCAIPSPTRIFEYADGNSKTPLSVSDGRQWLNHFAEGKELQNLPEESPVSKKSPVLEIKNLWFRYSREQNDIIKGLSLNVCGGEILAILGGNGSGKTTMLSLLSGIFKPYRGKIIFKDKSCQMAVLPQNPQTLFVKDSVEDDLYEIFDGMKISSEEMDERIEYVIHLCGLEQLRNRHPYDLSGGEQQKAALAKILLIEPNILILDEPTKGLDAHYKKRLAAIIKHLAERGTAVLMVSHDTEFCAEYSDRCAFFFNGRIVSIDTPRTFFSDNRIYTTPCRRMSADRIPNAVTADDILYSLHISHQKDELPKIDWKPPKVGASNQTANPKKPPKKRFKLFRYAFSIVLTVLFVMSVFAALGTMTVPFLSENKVLSYGLMFLSAAAIIAVLGNSSKKIKIAKSTRPFRYTFLSLLMIFVVVPLTVLAGVYFFDNTKYLFISLIIMLESILPFYIIFEKHKVQARELVLVATMCAMCVAGRAILYMLPQFKPVTALVIISGAALGSETGFLIGSVTMLVSNIFFGQGTWTPWQMVTMGLIGFLSGLIFERGMLPPNKITMCVYGFLCSFLYGAIMNPSTLILTGTPINAEGLLSVYAYGLPMDTVHAVSTALFLYIGAEPIIKKLERVKQKHGLIR